MAGEVTDMSNLQEKLREQIATSVKEALDKSTTILSNLHRLSSYLEVMNAMVTSPEHFKSALDQIQTVRSDSASLLQTIYLGEIAIQSLQDVGKAPLTGMLPMFSEALTSTINTSNSMTISTSNEGDPNDIFTDQVVTLGKRHGSGHLEDEPQPKKSTVAVFSCQSCGRRFGTNADPRQIPTHCRNCQTTSSDDGMVLTDITEHHHDDDTDSPILSSTPLLASARKQLKQRVSKRGKLQPLICKLCGISFFYRRCMFRHLRETHGPVINFNNLQQYIEMESGGPSQVSTSVAPTSASEPSSLNVTVGSDIRPDVGDFSVMTSGDQLSLDQSNNDSVSVSAANIINAVQDQAILEQAALLLQTQADPDGQDHQDQSQENLLDAADKSMDPDAAFREFKCTICSKAFDRPYRLTRHLEIHDPNRPRIPCNYCTKSFTRKDSLESHIKTIHASVHPYTCTHDSCTRSFATRSMYLNHLKVHGESKPYHCQECTESFTLLAELKDHLKKSHAENEDVRCTECFKVCASIANLSEHKLNDHRFECEICGKLFARLAYLQVHVKVHSGEAKFNCRFCSEGFDSIYAYRQHMKTHPEYKRVINVFPCHACDKSFIEPNELVAHYQTEEHRQKAASVGAPTGPSIALSMMEGDLSMSDLVQHVVMGESDEMIQGIVEAHNSYEVTSQDSQDSDIIRNIVDSTPNAYTEVTSQ